MTSLHPTEGVVLVNLGGTMLEESVCPELMYGTFTDYTG